MYDDVIQLRSNAHIFQTAIQALTSKIDRIEYDRLQAKAEASVHSSSSSKGTFPQPFAALIIEH